MENSPGKYKAESIAQYFDDYGLKEWQRLVATPTSEVSLFIHKHYLEKYITPGIDVLEIGAGAGRFTQILAELGARIVVADISAGQLALNRQHAREYGFARAVESWQQVDICDMGCFGQTSFDCVVTYGGPLSYTMEKRGVALGECKRVLKAGGLLLLSVMSLWGSAHQSLAGVLQMPIEANLQIVRTGDITGDSFPDRRDSMHLFRAAELRQWLTSAGWDIVALSASNCLTTGWDEVLQTIRSDARLWQALLEMELEACAAEGALDLGTHLIAVARVK